MATINFNEREMTKDWITYYLDIAEVVASKSKDATKVGAVIIDDNNVPVSFGFNGFIKGCDESQFCYHDRRLKYLGIVHAERNAIDHSSRSLNGCIMFCTHGPCDNCLKAMLNSGITTIYYRDPSIIRDRGTDDQKEAIRRLILATGANVINENSKLYLDEIWEKN